MNLGVLAASLLVAVCWSISPVVYKHVLESVHQSSVIFASAVIYFMLALIYFFIANAKKNIMKDVDKLMQTNILGWLVLANLTVFIGQIIYVYALDNHKSYVVTALAFTSPLFTLLLAWLLLKEEVSLRAIIGVITIVVGVILVAH